MRDTTVKVTKRTEAGGTFYKGGLYVVTAAAAAQLVKGGNAEILSEPPAKAEAKSEAKVSSKTKSGQSAEGDK